MAFKMRYSQGGFPFTGDTSNQLPITNMKAEQTAQPELGVGAMGEIDNLFGGGTAPMQGAGGLRVKPHAPLVKRK